MKPKWLISMEDDTMQYKLYYAAHDKLTGQIFWTNDPHHATTFSAQHIAERILNTLTKMSRTSGAYDVTVCVEEYPQPEKKAEEPPAAPAARAVRKKLTQVPAPPGNWHVCDLNKGIRLVMQPCEGKYFYAIWDGENISFLGREPDMAMVKFFKEKRDECLSVLTAERSEQDAGMS